MTTALIIVLAAIAAVLLIVAMQPAEFRIVRSTTIAASPEKVFPEVNDFHNWKAWSPWAKIDPAMKDSYDRAPAGTGASYYWNGNKKVGEGHMTITDSNPSDLICIKLEFMRPFAAINDVEFTFKPEDSGTLVTWTMTGRKNLMAKAFHLFVNVDKMVGGDFDKGLASMKAVVEGGAKD